MILIVIKDNENADESFHMEISTPEPEESDPRQLSRHKIEVPALKHEDGQIKLVNAEFDFPYLKDPVRAHCFFTRSFLIPFSRIRRTR